MHTDTAVGMCVHVCAHAHIACVYMGAHTRTWMYTCITQIACVCMNVHTCEYMCVQVCTVYMDVPMCAHVYMDVHMCAYLHMRVHGCV